MGEGPPGARTKRPYTTSIFIAYDTSFTQLATFRERLQQWLLQHPGIDKVKADIAVQRFTEEGVELTLNLQLIVENAAEEQQLRDVINGEVLRLAQAMEIGMASPRKPGLENSVPEKGQPGSTPSPSKRAG